MIRTDEDRVAACDILYGLRQALAGYDAGRVGLKSGMTRDDVVADIADEERQIAEYDAAKTGEA